MGANEKHEADNAGEFTPDTATIRTFYTSDTDGNPIPGRAAQFNRWLEAVRAEAKAEALNEVANAFQYKAWSELIQGSLQDRLHVAQPITAWLRARANQYQEDTANGR